MDCAWALAQRKVLYARQGVIAGRIAVLWSAVFVVGAVAAGYASGRAGAVPQPHQIIEGVLLTQLASDNKQRLPYIHGAFQNRLHQ